MLDLDVTINNHGGLSLKFGCRGTSDAISIWEMDIINSENSNDSTEFSTDEQFQIDDLDENLKDLTEFSRDEQFQNKVICNDIDENMKKAFLEYLEIRGIKPSIVDFLIKCVSNKKTKRKLMGLKKIKNFIEQLS
ncbi:hypothetical protein Q3G72_030789 [Acer saccharum]|nr:hypothetical protein Q3G72_030789 [Acer saccharum]